MAVDPLRARRYRCDSNQISHATVEATIRPLADMISIVVVSTTNTVEESLTARGRHGEAQFSYGVAFQFAPILMGLLCQKLKSAKKYSLASLNSSAASAFTLQNVFTASEIYSASGPLLTPAGVRRGLDERSLSAAALSFKGTEYTQEY
jgi:hypothetical protein